MHHNQRHCLKQRARMYKVNLPAAMEAASVAFSSPPRVGVWCQTQSAVRNGPISLSQAQVFCGSEHRSFPKVMMIARPRPRVLKGQSKGTVHSKAAVAAGTSGALCLLFALVRSMWHCEEVYMQEPTSRWGLASLRLALRRIKEEQGLAITEAAVDQEAQDMASEPGMVAFAGLRGWGLGWLGHWVLQCGAAVTLWLAHGVLVDSIGSLGFGAGTRVMRAVLSWARALGRQYVILQSLSL